MKHIYFSGSILGIAITYLIELPFRGLSDGVDGGRLILSKNDRRRMRLESLVDCKKIELYKAFIVKMIQMNEPNKEQNRKCVKEASLFTSWDWSI